ncbi:pyruvate ferredoxin oxidoreductase subunit gamma [Patescibacteria group bacterium]|nr:pyruvate ferredoxin oxidoreductase subunit gamma [Patescibacteria group bacterium]
MIEIRLHGRGGQGTVTAAELIAEAAHLDGKFSQAFPSFGIERRGAPVEAYARISDKPITLHSKIYKPDYLIIQDPTLVNMDEVRQGISKETFIVINTEKSPAAFRKIFEKNTIQTIPATQIALAILGKPIINTILLGAFAGVCGLLDPKSLTTAITARFKKEVAEKNLKAMNTAYCHCNQNSEYCFSAEKCEVAVDGGQNFSVTC